VSTFRRRDLFLLDPDVIFLNHGSFGACPRPVLEIFQEWQRELERQPVEFLGRRFKGLLRDAREALAAYVGADPDNLVYVTNATTGLNVIARSLPLAAGDEVLATDHEYGAVDRTWQFVCAQRGARYVRAPVPVPLTAPQEIVEAIWRQVTPRTRVLTTSHITSPTALIFPIAEMVRRARERGILTVIDGAHAPGQIPLSLRDLGVDFYVANCHKWMCAPKGSAFLYARPEVQALLRPLIVSWGWPLQGDGGMAVSLWPDDPSPFLREQEWQGTRDIAAFLATPAAIRFLQSPEWAKVPEVCHALAREARAAVAALAGLAPLSPDGPEWYAQMVSLPLPVTDGPSAQRAFYDQRKIEVPIVTWNDHRLLRISVQGYNTPEDIAALVAALRDLLAAPRE